MNHAEGALPTTTIHAPMIDAPARASEAEYRELYAFLFNDALKSKRFEARLQRQCDIIADQVAAAPSSASMLAAPAMAMVRTMLDAYFENQPLQDDPLHVTGQSRLDILAEERANDTLPLNKAVTQIYANMRRFAELAVTRAVAQGVAQQRGGRAL